MSLSNIALAALILGASAVGPKALAGFARARLPWLDRPRVREMLVVLALVLVTMSAYDRMVRGTPPTTADHNFHMLKTVQTENLLRRGHLTGWSDLELAGHPHNVLYPFGGTLLVAAIHALPGVSLERAYAWAMLLVELVTVLGVWAIARLHYTRAVALVAGIMALFDPGSWGVGGYAFTTDIGVWPSAVSIMLGMVGLALVPRAIERRTFRGALLPGALFGVGVLFHPGTVVVTGFALPFLLFALAVGDDRPPWRDVALAGLRIGAVAFAICAHWFIPFVAQRQFVYPAPHVTWPSGLMWTAMIDGYVFHQAGMFEGATICGVLLLARRRDAFSRLIVIFIPLALAFLTIESLKLFRLLGDGPEPLAARFQPERILYLVRVLAMIAAAFALVVLGKRAAVFTKVRGYRAPLLRLALGGALALAVILPGARVPGMVITPQGLKRPERARLEKALDAAIPLLGGGGRLVLWSEPGDHTMVGPAALRNVPIEKIGTSASTMFVTQFLTVDNSIWDLEMLRRTGARAVLCKGTLPSWLADLPQVAQFGEFQVRSIEPLPRAWVQGAPGEARVVSWTEDRIELDVTGTGGAGEVRLMLGYYDAWRVEGGGPVGRWVWHGQALAEVPAREGRTVIAYRRPASEWVGVAVSLLLAAACAGLFVRERRSLVGVERQAHPVVVEGKLGEAAGGDGKVEHEPGLRVPAQGHVVAGGDGDLRSPRPDGDGASVDSKRDPPA